MSYGFTDDRWMAKQVIKSADPRYVKFAVVQLLDKLFEDGNISALEVVDRLVQVSSTGEYHPPVDVGEDEGTTILRTEITPDQLDELMETLNIAPVAEGAPETIEDYEKFRKIWEGEDDDDDEHV